ncbi:MAG: hypothetical protein Q8N03_16805 [Ignavibacteria bacterium]|jgi:predicted anti-sigma-YlaC factor YlaD|nr:hypothetical protein [Ignavibacteria bacterium]
MKKEKVTCRDVMEHVCESLGEDLESPKCRAIKSHLESCSVCQNYFHSVEHTIDFYKLYNVDLPDDAHNRLMKILNLENE